MDEFKDIKSILIDFFNNMENVIAIEKFRLELFRWNKYINFTSYVDIREVTIKLFLDSLALKPLILGRILLDIGSGAGFPGLVLALAIPIIVFFLLESKGKRVIFQRQIVRILGINNVRLIYGRVEEERIINKGCFDIVTLKAFGSLEKSLYFSQKFLKKGGRVLLLKSIDEVFFALKKGLIVLTYDLPYPGSRRVIILYQEII